jgi:hypothetical protein
MGSNSALTPPVCRSGSRNRPFNGKVVEVELHVPPDNMVGIFLKSVTLFYSGDRERDNVHGKEAREWARD